MKFLPLLFIICCSSLFAESRIVISGKIIHPEGDSVIIEYDFDPVLSFRHKEVVKLNPQNEFKLILHTKNPYVLGRFWHGDEIFDLFYWAGDSVSLSLDSEDFDGSLHFTGRGEDFLNLQQYINIRKNTPERQARFQSLLEINEASPLFAFRDSSLAENLVYIHSHSQGISPEKIAFLCKDKIYGNAEFKIGYPWKSKSMGKEVLVTDEDYTFLDTMVLNDAYMLGTFNYRSFIDHFLIFKTRNDKIKSYVPFYEAGKKYFTGQPQDAVLGARIKAILQMNYNLGIDSLYQRYLLENTNAEYDSVLRATYQYRIVLSVGKKAPDFTLKGVDGKDISLSNFRGKIVFLDFWSSSCAPCIAQFPAARKMEEAFKDKEVVFISIGMDREEYWKKGIENFSPPGIQLLADFGDNGKVAKDYHIKGYPIYYLIDKEGIICNDNPPRPSQEELFRTELEKALER